MRLRKRDDDGEAARERKNRSTARAERRIMPNSSTATSRPPSWLPVDIREHCQPTGYDPMSTIDTLSPPAPKRNLSPVVCTAEQLAAAMAAMAMVDLRPRS